MSSEPIHLPHNLDALASPSLSFGHNLRLANRLTQKLLAVRVSHLNLTIAQWYSLRALWEQDRITQSDLAERACIAGPALVAAVTGLVDRGFVTRKAHASDRRKMLLFLTEQGNALREGALQASLDVNAEVLRGIEKDNVQIALRVLRAVQANCADLHGPSDAVVAISDMLRSSKLMPDQGDET